MFASASVPDAISHRLQTYVPKVDDGVCPRGAHGPPTLHTTIRSLVACDATGCFANDDRMAASDPMLRFGRTQTRSLFAASQPTWLQRGYHALSGKRHAVTLGYRSHSSSGAAPPQCSACIKSHNAMMPCEFAFRLPQR